MLQAAVNVTKINRLKSRIDKTGSSIPKRGRPSAASKEHESDSEENLPNEEPPPKTLRRSGPVYNKDLCIICQKPGGTIHKVATGQKMLELAQLLQDEKLLLHLNNISNAADAVANNVQYHLLCWSRLKKRAAKINSEDYHQVLDDPKVVLADIEIINIIDSLIQDGEFLDMKNGINTTYNNLLDDTGAIITNHKRYLKGLLQENVKGICFSKPKSRRESEVVSSNSTNDHLQY